MGEGDEVRIMCADEEKWHGQSRGAAQTHVDVAAAAVALDLFEALDVEHHVATQVTLGGVLVHLLTQLGQLLLGEVPRALVVDVLHCIGGR